MTDLYECTQCGQKKPAKNFDMHRPGKEKCYACRNDMRKALLARRATLITPKVEPKGEHFAWLDLGADQRHNYNDNNRYVPSDAASKHYRHYSI